MAPYTILFRQVFIFFFFPGDGKFLRVISEKKKKTVWSDTEEFSLLGLTSARHFVRVEM
jgi:hypothetical protein